MRRVAWRLLCAVLLVLLACPIASATKPILSIVFTGNTLGMYAPCDRCGEDPWGGLGKRSTFLHQMLQSSSTKDEVLLLAGAHEFLPLRVRKPIPGDLAKALSSAYALLPYDLGYLTPRENVWLEKNGAAPPKGWLVIGKHPMSRVLQKGGMDVGVVVFPALGDPFATPDEATMSEAALACENMRSKVDLLIAMSPWGERAEKRFFMAHGAVAGILLGSGPALGAGVREESEGRTLWVRAMYDGQKMPVLRILSVNNGDGGKWIEGVNYEFEAIPLDSRFRADHAVNNIFAWF